MTRDQIKALLERLPKDNIPGKLIPQTLGFECRQAIGQLITELESSEEYVERMLSFDKVKGMFWDEEEDE